MTNIFKTRALYWDVIFRNSKGIIKTARLKADDEIELLTKIEKTFKHAEVLDFVRA